MIGLSTPRETSGMTGSLSHKATSTGTQAGKNLSLHSNKHLAKKKANSGVS